MISPSPICGRPLSKSYQSPGGSTDAPVERCGIEDRGDQQRGAKEEAVLDRGELLVLRPLEPERAHRWHPGLAGLAQEPLQVGEEPVAALDGLAVAVLPEAAEGPGLLVRAAAHRVDPHQPEEGADLQPARKQLWRGPSGVAADVRPVHRHSGDPHVQRLGDREREILDAGVVVAAPARGPALDAGEGGAGHHEGAAVRTQLLQALAGGPGHLLAVDVVQLAVAPGPDVGVVAGIAGEGLELGHELRLVHVGPDAVEPDLREARDALRPPTSHLLACEVGKDAVPGQTGP